jgi:SAM-dependent methyltransferase
LKILQRVYLDRRYFLFVALSSLQRFNSRIDDYLAPDLPNRRKLYRQILSDLDFNRGLHLGSGVDDDGLGVKLEKRGDIIALDPDRRGLTENQVRKKVLADGQRLPFNDDEFNLVFSEYVFEHLPDPESALEETDRILQPGGDFVLLVPNPSHYYARISDMTPFALHKFWLKLQGREDVERDYFPTQYEWGAYADVTDPGFSWEIEDLYSFPGPTGYTRILPFHILFTLLTRLRIDQPQHHVAYVVHYSK